MRNNNCNKDSLLNWTETDLLAQDRIRIQISKKTPKDDKMFKSIQQQEQKKLQ